MTIKPTDPGFFDVATIISVDWHDQHKYAWWSGTIVAELDDIRYVISVEGDPSGCAFKMWEHIGDWEVE